MCEDTDWLEQRLIVSNLHGISFNLPLETRSVKAFPGQDEIVPPHSLQAIPGSPLSWSPRADR